MIGGRRIMSARPLFYSFPRVIGHRGARGLAPENTLAAIRAARDCGLSWIEVDVRLTRDAVPVLSHDPVIAPGDGALPVRIAALDAEMLRKRIPSVLGLADALALARASGLNVNVELKSEGSRNSVLARKVAAQITAFARISGPSVLLSSFEKDLVADMAALLPHIPRALILARAAPRDIEAARRLECVSVHIARRGADFGTIAAIHRHGMRCAVYTVNRVAAARRLFAVGADGVFTDRPDRFSAIEKNRPRGWSF